MALSTIMFVSEVVIYRILIIMKIGCRVYENKQLLKKILTFMYIVILSVSKETLFNRKPFAELATYLTWRVDRIDTL